MATINGTSGDDTLNGTSSADKIYGFGGNDTLNGNGGNDQLDGGTGADTMSGGTGSDIYWVDDVGDSVIELSGEGNDEVRTTLASYTLGADVEKLKFIGTGSFIGVGNDLNNDITGGADPDILVGEDGHDGLYGGLGDDELFGGAGFDTLSGGGGADYMEGGDDNDAYMVDHVDDIVFEISGGGDGDQAYVSISSYTLPDEVENVSYSAFTGAFFADGNALDNIMYGGGGDDFLGGQDGADTLRGNSGADYLDGGDGDDLLVGGAGADIFDGGAGADTYRIGYYESGTGTDADTVASFASGDLIDVAGWDANITTGGDQAFSFVGASAFTNTAGELRAASNGTNTIVQGDINGDSTADFEIVVAGAVTLAGSDFIL
ncbi:MAG TPA: calcium-binding protein [Allosphingosinicella sp.]|jgi:Ca2+-binding RTX toxin-like protein